MVRDSLAEIFSKMRFQVQEIIVTWIGKSTAETNRAVREELSTNLSADLVIGVEIIGFGGSTLWTTL